MHKILNLGGLGYTRVFKQACRARDQREAIHPNANEEPGKAGPAQAEFELMVDGAAQDVHWLSGKVAPEQLSAVSIFDWHCARAYVDNHGDFAYVPAGLDILKRLVEVCGELKTKAVKEHGDNAPDIVPSPSWRRRRPRWERCSLGCRRRPNPPPSRRSPLGRMRTRSALPPSPRR